MSDKRYRFTQGHRAFEIHAEQEGNARYMVRMHELSGRSSGNHRIGYLTGHGKHWLGECYGSSAPGTQKASTAKDACFALAEDAVQRGVFG